MAESCIKWLTDIVVREDEAAGYYMQTAYRVPSSAGVQGAGGTGSTVPVEVMPVKSLIVSPPNGQVTNTGPITIRGVAWAGEVKVANVEVSMDEGTTWKPARLLGDDLRYAWRQWQFMWTAKVPGTFTILCRATDADGAQQPAVSPWNPSGFLWNGWDRVTLQVKA
jgi:DMSO/TMAO reductase YedYZ molybdopterin-dependent catalytic subunit